jgi:hypothetical protein
MNIKSLKLMVTGWFASLPLPVWAAQSNPGIDPTLFVLTVGAAVVGGAIAGYVAGSQTDEDGSS